MIYIFLWTFVLLKHLKKNPHVFNVQMSGRGGSCDHNSTVTDKQWWSVFTSQHGLFPFFLHFNNMLSSLELLLKQETDSNIQY